MKKLKPILVFEAVLLFCLASCEKEVINVVDPNEEYFKEISVEILASDNVRYDYESWKDAEAKGLVQDSDAVGIIVSNATHGFVIHPTAESNVIWSSNLKLVDTLGTYTSIEELECEIDFDGKENTETIMKSVAEGILNDAPAAEYCSGITFANGNKGYLMSAGELTMSYHVSDEINLCLKEIGGTEFNQFEKYYWTSTQFSERAAWSWGKTFNKIFCLNKKSQFLYARAVTTI